MRPAPLQGSFTHTAGVAARAASEFQANVATLAFRESSQLDDLQKENALNELRSRELELSAGPDGFSQYKGNTALQNNIVDDYTHRHEAAVSEVASTLKNPRQQAAFRTAAAASAVTFKSALYRHVAVAADQVDGQVLRGTVAVEGAAAASNWRDPQALNDSRVRIEHTIDLYAERRGLPPEETARLRLSALSPMHANVATQAVAAGQFDYAEKYLSDNNEEMSVDELLRLSGEINKQRGATIGVAAAQRVIGEVQQQTQPTDFGRLSNAKNIVESGNRDFNPDGTPVTSSTGAKYRGQVLPSTAMDPGFGIKPAKEDSAKEYNRVSDEYLAAMLQRYNGDVNKALAAYNVGAGAVDKAIKIADKSRQKNMAPRRSLADLTDPTATVLGGDIEAAAGPTTPTDWFTVLTDTSGPGASGILPVDQAAQVAAYVPKVVKLYSAGGGGVAEMPTIVDIRRRVADLLQGQPQAVVDAAQARAERDFNDMKAARTQQQDEAVQKVLPLIQSGLVASTDDIPSDIRTALGPNLSKVQKFIATNNRATDEALRWSPVATDFYFALQNDTQRLKQTPTADIMALAPDIGRARTLDLIETKNTVQNDFDAESNVTFDRELIAQTAKAFGFKTETPEQRRVLIPIIDRARDALISAQADAGHKLGRNEKRDVLNRMFVPLRVGSEQPLWRKLVPFVDDSVDVTRRGFELQSPAQVQVPADIREQIVQAGKSKGLELTDAEIREEYAFQQIQKTYQGLQ